MIQKPVTATTDFVAYIETDFGKNTSAIEFKPLEELEPLNPTRKKTP